MIGTPSDKMGPGVVTGSGRERRNQNIEERGEYCLTAVVLQSSTYGSSDDRLLPLNSSRRPLVVHRHTFYSKESTHKQRRGSIFAPY